MVFKVVNTIFLIVLTHKMLILKGSLMTIPVLSIPEVYTQASAVRIFVHAVTSVGDISVVNLNDKGAARTVLLAQQNDIVVIASPLEKECISYYKQLGFAFDPARIIVVNLNDEPSLIRALLKNEVAFKRIIALLDNWHGKVIVDTFTVTESELQFIAKLQHYLPNPISYIGSKDLVLSQAVNRKDVARQFAIAANIPVAPAEIITDVWSENNGDFNDAALLKAIQRQIQLTGSVVVKGAIGASGSSIFVIKSSDDIDNVLTQLAQRHDNNVYLVEPLFSLSSAPNITVWISPDGTIALVNNSNQCLSERLVFAGNQYPCSSSLYPDIVQASERLAQYLYQQGITGWAGFDFVEYYDSPTNSYQFFFSEINARYNAGMYAKTVFDVIQQQQQQQGLPVPSGYVTENLLLAPLSFATLRKHYQDLLFDPVCGYGVIPYNPGRLIEGVAAFICIATHIEQAQQLANVLRQRSVD